MAPSSSVTIRRAYAVGARRKIEKRVTHDIIDGVDIYSFDSELEMEYFTNIEEPLPRKIRKFRGFEDRCAALDLLKNSFESFVRNYRKKETLPVLSETSDNFFISKKNILEKDENSLAGGKAPPGLVIVDETVANHTIDPGVATTVPLNNGTPFEIADKQAEVITVDDSDSDDDVVMVGDPTAPLPKPVQNCCPNCGKFRRAKPSSNGGKLKIKNKGTDEDDDVVIVIDDEVPDKVEASSEAPIMANTDISAQPQEAISSKDSITQEVTADELSLPNESLVQPEKPSAPQIRKRIASSSQEEPPVKAQGVSSGTDEVPAKIQINQQMVPHTVTLVLPETGKTVILKLDGTKSKLLHPSAKRPSVRTIQVIVPQRELQDRVIVPQSHDQNGIRAQPGNEATRIVPLVPNSFNSKPGFVAVTSSSSSPIKVTKKDLIGNTQSPNKISVKSVEDGRMATYSFQVKSGAPTEPGCPTEVMSGEKPASTDTQSSKPLVVGNTTPSVTQLNQINSGGNLVSIDTQSSKPLVVGDATKSVVKGLVDYVCRKEQFPESFPYDEVRTETPYSLVPCKELRCRLGCVCISLAKKTVRRPRCKNASCIFGCNCMSHGGFKNRHSKTVRNEKKIMGVPRRRQALTVLPRDTVSSATGCGTQTALKRFLPVQKASQFAKPMVQRLAPESDWPLGLGPGHSTANSQLSSHKSDVAPLSVSLTQRRFFGREKVPIPDRALMCMTPGLGYVPLVDIAPKVTLHNPFQQGSTKSFLNVREATEWLNSQLREIFASAPDLRWVVADKSTIEKKQLNRFSVDALKNPNCLISGPVLK